MEYYQLWLEYKLIIKINLLTCDHFDKIDFKCNTVNNINIIIVGIASHDHTISVRMDMHTHNMIVIQLLQ